MRITGGTAKGRTLGSPKQATNSIRPTSDRVREALFSILGDRVVGARVLDLFAGTGSLGLEALSRGAANAIFVDSSLKSLELIRANLGHCRFAAQATLLKLDLGKPSGFTSLARRLQQDAVFDLILLDPPYEKKLAELALTMVDTTGIVAAGGLVVAEERWKIALPESIGGLKKIQHRRYGDTGIWLYTTANPS